ncbi:MAG: hypothetical protein H6557_05640 [Lewinellaceae bacterium]|nr:hypothetical protein [Lewinellaceae bacterium]
MKTSAKILVSLALWIILMILPSFVWQTVSWLQAISLTLLLIAAFSISNYTISSLFPKVYQNSFSSFSWTGISILTGLLLFIPILFFTNWTSILYLVLLFFLVGVVSFFRKIRQNGVSIDPDIKSQFIYFFTSLLAMAVINHGELMKIPFAHHVYSVVEKNPDSAFFTSIVASYGGQIKNGAIYEVGSPIDYHVFAYLFPAVIQKLTGISAFVAYNGVFNIFIYVLFYLLLIDLSRLLISEKLPSLKPLHYSLIPLFYILLVPLNPKGIFNLDFMEIIWGGPGFIAPGGNLGSSFAMVITLIALICYCQFRNTKKEHNNRYFLTLFALSFLLIQTKITFFVAFAIFIPLDQFVLLMRNFQKKQFKLFSSYILIFLVGVIAYVFFNQSGSDAQFSIKYGYLVSNLNMLNLTNIFTATLFAFFLMFFWLLTRIVVALFIKSHETLKTFFFLSVGLVLVTSAFPLLLKIKLTKFNIQIDKTFDLMQFLRAGYMYPSIFASVAAPLIYSYWNKVFIIFSLFLLLFPGGNYLLKVLNAPEITKDQRLFYTGYEQIIKDDLTAIYPIDNYRSIQIASTGKFSLYSAMDFSNNGYNAGSIHPERWEKIQNLEDSDRSIPERFTPLQEDDVKYLLVLKGKKQPFDELETVFENDSVAIQKLENL